MARVDPIDEHGSVIAGRVQIALALEKAFDLDFRGEVCKRSFDGWRTINLCNSAKGEILTGNPGGYRGRR